MLARSCCTSLVKELELLLALNMGQALMHQIGWKPGPNEPKPLERGSASQSLKDILQ